MDKLSIRSIIRLAVNNAIASAMRTRKLYNLCQTRETVSKLSRNPTVVRFHFYQVLPEWMKKVCFLRIFTNVNKKVKVGNKAALPSLSFFFSETSEEEEDENKAMLR